MKQVISVRLEQSTIDKLKKQAEKEHRSLSNLVGLILEQYTHIDELLRDKAVKK